MERKESGADAFPSGFSILFYPAHLFVLWLVRLGLGV